MQPVQPPVLLNSGTLLDPVVPNRDDETSIISDGLGQHMVLQIVFAIQFLIQLLSIIELRVINDFLKTFFLSSSSSFSDIS